MSDTPETDAAVIASGGDWSPILRETCRRLERQRNMARKEINEWKNKAYSTATDYTLMEAKCFRLEQQLKEYDQLKS
jgi:hypothetical protein